MEWLLMFSAVLCSWALLRALGSEREKRLTEMPRTAHSDATPPNPPQPRKA